MENDSNPRGSGRSSYCFRIKSDNIAIRFAELHTRQMDGAIQGAVFIRIVHLP